MKASELMELLQQRFFDKLETKTGWGRNELKLLFLETAVEVTSELINLDHP
jgi:hypothetical protein